MYSHNTPQRFSRGTSSHAFSMSKKYASIFLECSQDFSNFYWRMKVYSITASTKTALDILKHWFEKNFFLHYLLSLFLCMGIPKPSLLIFQNTRLLDTHDLSKELLCSQLRALQVGFHGSLQPCQSLIFGQRR